LHTIKSRYKKSLKELIIKVNTKHILTKDHKIGKKGMTLNIKSFYLSKYLKVKINKLRQVISIADFKLYSRPLTEKEINQEENSFNKYYKKRL